MSSNNQTDAPNYHTKKLWHNIQLIKSVESIEFNENLSAARNTQVYALQFCFKLLHYFMKESLIYINYFM